jgi:hypothetical protein
MKEVDRRVDQVMGRDPLQWKVQHICPPCLYKTVGEPSLKFSLLACMDGNNSLKLVDSTFKAGTPRTDDRVSNSVWWLTPEQVNCFKDEVLNSQSTVCPLPCYYYNSTAFLQSAKPPINSSEFRPDARYSGNSNHSSGTNATDPLTSTITKSPEGPSTCMGVEDDDTDLDPDDENTAWLNVVEHEELAKCLDTCVNRWRNASPEARKKMYALFAIAGIFLAVCRHGHVLVICDMIRSGELYVPPPFPPLSHLQFPF